MSNYCECCDKTVKLQPKNNHLKLLCHKESDKCKHIILGNKNPNISKLDIAVCENNIEHN